MSTDDSDKTVFQPAKSGNPDHTAMRPMPGGRGMARPQPGAARPAAPPPPQYAPQATATEADAAFFRKAQGLNPIVNAAASLIAVFEKTHGTASHADIGGLHQRLTNEIRLFEEKLRQIGRPPEINISVRYIMCTVLDEAVLNTPWGSESAWAQRTLLSVFHKEAAGGEKFFLILDRMRQAPADNIDVLELMYICLSLGFEGKYRLLDRGREAIEHIRDDLFSIIRRHRGDYERSLADRWQGLGRSRNTLAHFIPMWVIVVAVIAILFFSFSGFRWWLYKTSDPIADQLNNISTTALEEIEEEKNNSLLNN